MVMAALKRFDGEHHETSHHTCRILHTERQEADGTVKVECVIEEVEIRTNVKYLTMKRFKAAKQTRTDAGAPDLIDLIDSPRIRRGDGQTKTRESPVLGPNGYSSLDMPPLVLLSDGDESSEAQSDAMSTELICDSESEDEGRPMNLGMYPGPNVSPELSTTPLTLSLSLPSSQDPMSAVSIEDVERGYMSDDSHCSIASGPSKPPQPLAHDLCTDCVRLHMRMKKQAHWTKSTVKDPACLYYDQWWLLKPWRPRGVRSSRRVKGKLFKHLPFIWQRAKVRAEGDHDNDSEVCSRPHVFLQRNLRRSKTTCPNSLPQTQARSKAGSRRGRRSHNRWPPIGGSRPAKKRKSKSTEGSVKGDQKKSMKKVSVGSSKKKEMDGKHKTVGEDHLAIGLTADSSPEEHVNHVSPDGHQETNADTRASGDLNKHGNVNTLGHSDAKAGSQSHRHTDESVGSSPAGTEDSLVDMRTDHRRDGCVDGHGESWYSSPNSVEADGHSGVKSFKYVVSGADGDACRSADWQPLIRLVKWDSANGNGSTDEQTNRLEIGRAPRRHKGEHSCPQDANRPTGRDGDASPSREAGDPGTCLTRVARCTKSHPEDAFNGHSDVDPDVHLNSPSSVNGDKGLNGPGWHVHRPACRFDVEDQPEDLSLGMGGKTCRPLSFEDVLKKPSPAAPLMTDSTAPLVVGAVQTTVSSALPPAEDPYAFHTPTPSGTQSSEVHRKLRPFARTYESRRTEPDGFRSMLSSWDRSFSGVVRETDLCAVDRSIAATAKH